MSSVVEQKILEMRFDNKQFEDNVSESISTLDKLKTALNFDKFTDTFSSVSAAAGKVDFSPLTDGVDTVIVKFNALELAAVQAIANIIENGLNKLQSVVNDLSLDQITAGWEKYNEKTSSVQTIMNATGKSIEEVNEQLSRLNWFSDETSFSFTDMTSNVGKFTAVNVELEDAVTAMEGISVWAALSGQNASEASRAYYNLAQAMAVGSVKLMDWRSIENAQMATTEFKQAALETAAAMGTLREFADGTYQTIDKGTNVTIKDFNSALSEGWFTSEVLMETLNKFGGYANELSKVCAETGVSATKMDQAFADWINDQKSWEDIVKDTGIDADTLRLALERLSDTEYELGHRSFLAAQQAKTFTEALDATRDAVSTGWMNTFEYLFGNYEEAAKLFTGVTNYLWDIFAASGEVRNQILEEWSDAGGGDLFREGILNIFKSAADIVEFIRELGYKTTGVFRNTKESLSETFSFSQSLVQLTKNFYNWTVSVSEFTEELYDNLQWTDGMYEGLNNLFKGIGYSLEIVFKAVNSLRPVFSWLLGVFGDIFRYFTENVFWSIGESTRALRDFIENNDIFGKTVRKVTDIASKGWNTVKEVLQPISDLLQPIIEKIDKFFTGGKQYQETYTILAKIRNKISEIFDSFKTNERFVTSFSSIKAHLISIKDSFTIVLSKVIDFFSGFDLSSNLSNIWKFLKNILGTLWDIGSYIGGKFLNFGSDIVNTFKNMFSGIRQAFKDYKIEDVFSSIGTGLTGVIQNLGSADISGLLGNLSKGALALGGFNLAKLFGSMNKGVETLTGNISEGGIGGALKSLISPVTDVFDQLKETIGSFTKNTDSEKLTAIAVAVGVLTAALVVLSGIDSDKMATALEGLAGVLIGLGAEMKALSKIDFSNGKQMKNIGLGMVEIAAAALIIVEAIKPFADMKPEQMVKALAAMTVVLTEFGLFIAAFGAISRANQVGNTKSEGIFGLFQKSNGFDKQLKNAAFAMIELGAAMKIFASAVKDFDDVNGLKRSIGAMTIVMAEMAAFIFVASKLDTKGITGVAFAMIELGAAMKIFASAAADFGEIERIGSSITASLLILTEMVAFLIVVDNIDVSAGKVTAIAFGMIELGAAMKVFASALSDIGSMEYEQIRDSIAALIAVMLQEAAFMIIASKVSDNAGQILVIAGSMVVLGLAMQTFAQAMKVFAQNEPHEWMNAVVEMTACFAAMLIFIGVANAVAANAAQITLIAASMIVLGLAMQTFAAAAKDFTGVQWESLGKAGAVLGGAVVAIAALAAIGTVAGAGLAVVATSLLAIGGAIALIGVGIAALNLGMVLGKLADIGQRLVFMTDAATGFLKALSVKEAVNAFVEVLLALPRVMTGVIAGLISGVIEGIGTILGSIGSLLNGAKTAILEFLSFAEEVAPAIIDSLLTILLETAGSLLEKAPEILVIIGDLVLKILDALIEYLPKIVEKVSKLFIKLFENLKQYIPEIVVAFLDFMGALLQAIIDVAANTDQQTLLKLAEMFTGLIAVIAVLNIVKGLIPGALLGLAEIAVFVAALGGIIAAFGLLSKIPGIEMLVDEGGDFLMKISTAIGKFVGGLVGGFAEGATSTLPQVGKNIADFWTNVKPFIDGVSKIGLDTVEKVGILSASILVLTAADLLGGIVDFMRDKTNTQEFGVSITKMWNNIKPFIDGIKNLDPNVTASVKALSEALLILTAAQLIDGITSFIFGKQDIDKFGESISTLGPYLKSFSDSVKDINTDAVKIASESINLLAETFNNGAFKTGGLAQWFSGENDLKKFGEGLSELGPLIMSYAKSVEGLPVDVIENSVKGATALTEMAKTVPPSGGLLQAMTGKRDLVEFAKGLSLMGPSLVKYADAVKDLDGSVVDKSILIAKAISEFGKNLEEKSLVDRIFGADKMTEFSTSITTFGTSIKTFYDDIKDISSEHIREVMNGIVEMMEMFSKDSGKTFKIDKSFTKALKDAADNGIKEFVNAINNSLPLVSQKGIEIVVTIQDALTAQKNNLISTIDDLLSAIVSRISSNFSTFKRYGANLMASFNAGMSSMMSAGTDVANKFIQQIKKAMSSFTSGMKTTTDSFSSEMTILMGSFITGMTGMTGDASEVMSQFVQNILDQFTSDTLKNSFETAGKDLMTSFSRGIDASVSVVQISSSSIGQAALTQMNSLDLMNSFVTAGSNAGKSFASGLESQREDVIAAAKSLKDDAKTAVNEGLKDLQDRINLLMKQVNLSPVITPVLDLTDISRKLTRLRNEYNDIKLNVDWLYKEAGYIDNAYQPSLKSTSNSNIDKYTGPIIEQNFYGDNVDPNAVKQATEKGIGIAAERRFNLIDLSLYA